MLFTRQWAQAETLTRNNVHSLEACQSGMSSKLATFSRYRPEVDILPGRTWKCSMRSAFYWFAEFCHSQRLSHFAASFIVTRAEGSIAKSCKRNFLQRKNIPEEIYHVYLLAADAPAEAGSSNAFESIQMRHRIRHELTVRFRFKKLDYLSCKWSFRRFTYGNLVTTSPSSKWLGLNKLSTLETREG